MDLLLEGTFNTRQGIKELLQKVLEQQAEYGILRISSPQANISGRLSLAGPGLIISAQMIDRPELGWQAARMLLSLPEGNYAFLATDYKQLPAPGCALHISIAALLDRWPLLPEDPANLFDEKTLLDAVFGDGPADQIEEKSLEERSQIEIAAGNQGSTLHWQGHSELPAAVALISDGSPILTNGARTRETSLTRQMAAAAIPAPPKNKTVLVILIWAAVVGAAALLAFYCYCQTNPQAKNHHKVGRNEGKAIAARNTTYNLKARHNRDRLQY